MKIIRYPENISKQDFLQNYSKNMLTCVKASLASSYKQVLKPDDDELWYKYLNLNLDKGVRYVLLLDGEIVRGYIVWFFNEDEVEFYDLYIHPDYQCDGSTLRRLLTLFAYDIKDMEFRELLAYTNFKNDRMNKLLIKRGFKVQQVKKNGTLYFMKVENFLKRFK